MSGAESTPKETRVDYRWDSPKGREDREVYDEIFDCGVVMLRSSSMVDQAVGKLLLVTINEWEKNSRAVPQQIVSAAYSVAEVEREGLEVVALAEFKYLEEKKLEPA